MFSCSGFDLTSTSERHPTAAGTQLLDHYRQTFSLHTNRKQELGAELGLNLGVLTRGVRIPSGVSATVPNTHPFSKPKFMVTF